jgi:hypothetical protein
MSNLICRRGGYRYIYDEDGLHLANVFLEGTGHPKMFCMPSAGNSVLSSISGVQMVDLVMGFLQRNPQRRHELTAKLIIDAFKESFPCQ